MLKQKGISSTYYHGGMERGEKIVNARLWLDDKVDTICRTSAFGMGIDKKDVRYVIRFNLPATIEQLAQEGGRAGRDGDYAICKFYYNFSDRTFHLRNIAGLVNPAVQQHHMILLNKVTEFCFEKEICRHRLLATYFNENSDEDCSTCDNCQQEISHVMQVDESNVAKDIIYCLRELYNIKQYVRLSELVMTFMGSKAKDVIDQKLDRCDHFGKGKGKFRSSQKLTQFVQHLVVKGHLKESYRGIQDKQCIIYIEPDNVYDILENKVKIMFSK